MSDTPNTDRLQALVESGALDRPKKPAMTNTTDISKLNNERGRNV